MKLHWGGIGLLLAAALVFAGCESDVTPTPIATPNPERQFIGLEGAFVLSLHSGYFREPSQRTDSCPPEVAVYPDGLVLATFSPCHGNLTSFAIHIGPDEVAQLRALVNDAKLRSDMDRLPDEAAVTFGEGSMWIVQAINERGEPVEVIIADLGKVQDDLHPGLLELNATLGDLFERVRRDGEQWPLTSGPSVRIAPVPDEG